MLTKAENIPDELKKVKQWVCWKGEAKIPINPYTGQNAKSNDSSTWGTFDDAIKACEERDYDGLGFEFAPPYFGIDLDHCLEDSDFVDEFVESLQSYTEISRSGTGIHIICKGKLPDKDRRKGNVEMYSAGRYFIFTGNIYNPAYSKIKDCTESVKFLYDKYFPNTAMQMPTKISLDLDDSEIIDKARACRSGSLFSMLQAGEWEGFFTSQSEADLAFCNQLAFWTGRNPAQMDRIFRNSGLYRKKWDAKRGHDTYGNITINKACASCEEVYDPRKYSEDATLAIRFFKNGKVGTSNDGNDKRYDATDTGNAHRLYDKFGESLKYSYNRKKWYIWTGKIWMLDEAGEVKKRADEICEDLKKEAWNIPDEELQQAALKFAKRTAGSSAKEAMIKECQHLYDIPASPDAFDAYMDYLNCRNGVINLRTGELMPHDSRLMLTKICNAEYDPKNKKPKMWLKFLNEITAGDKKLQEYIQKSVGYSISGNGQEQCAYFLYGIGNNGKSTFLDTISDMLGDYAANTQPDTIMLSSKLSGGGGANTDVARLKSARFVTCEEPPEGVRLNEGLLKQLTGGSKVTCRFLYGDEFEYTPEFKIWCATNHKPIIRGTDVGIWRRIKLIPFEVNIPKEKVDKNLKYKLRQEFSQILSWAVEGYMKWRSDGLDEPQQVLDATKDYKKEMDLIAGFVEQCITIDYDTDEKISASDLFSVYCHWAKLNNEWEMSAKKFGMEIIKKIPERGRNGKGIFYSKIRLTDYARDLIPRKYSAADFK